MNCDFTDKNEIKIIGIACRTSNGPNQAQIDIPKLWERFYKENVIESIPNKASLDIIALYCDYEGDHTKPYSLVIGCRVSSVDDIPHGMVVKAIKAGPYAVFKTQGEFPQSVVKMWNHIWESNLNRAFTGDYEIYGKNFTGPEAEVEVVIAIKD